MAVGLHRSFRGLILHVKRIPSIQHRLPRIVVCACTVLLDQIKKKPEVLKTFLFKWYQAHFCHDQPRKTDGIIGSDQRILLLHDPCIPAVLFLIHIPYFGGLCETAADFCIHPQVLCLMETALFHHAQCIRQHGYGSIGIGPDHPSSVLYGKRDLFVLHLILVHFRETALKCLHMQPCLQGSENQLDLLVRKIVLRPVQEKLRLSLLSEIAPVQLLAHFHSHEHTLVGCGISFSPIHVFHELVVFLPLGLCVIEDLDIHHLLPMPGEPHSPVFVVPGIVDLLQDFQHLLVRPPVQFQKEWEKLTVRCILQRVIVLQHRSVTPGTAGLHPFIPEFWMFHEHTHVLPLNVRMTAEESLFRLTGLLHLLLGDLPLLICKHDEAVAEYREYSLHLIDLPCIILEADPSLVVIVKWRIPVVSVPVRVGVDLLKLPLYALHGAIPYTASRDRCRRHVRTGSDKRIPGLFKQVVAAVDVVLFLQRQDNDSAPDVILAELRHSIEIQSVLCLCQRHADPKADGQDVVALVRVFVQAKKLVRIVLRQAGAQRNLLAGHLVLTDHLIHEGHKAVSILLLFLFTKVRRDLLCPAVLQKMQNLRPLIHLSRSPISCDAGSIPCDHSIK